MGKVVAAVCVALFALAVGYIGFTRWLELAGLLDTFRAEPFLQKMAWVILVAAPLAIVLFAFWLWHSLGRQRVVASLLQQRLSGVKQDLKELAVSQDGVDASAHHLARTDPEEAIGSLRQRLNEAERLTQVQQARNEFGSLQSKADEIRTQQQALKSRLGPILDKRRAIEQLFLELESEQTDIDRNLAEIATGDDAVALETRLKEMLEFGRKSHARCDDIEQGSKTIAKLKEDYAALQSRVQVFADADGGVPSRLRDLREAKETLSASLNSLQQTPEGALTERVASLSSERDKLAEGLSQLGAEFHKLSALRKDLDGLSAGFDRALDVLSINADGKGEGGVDARVEELWQFIRQTQAQLEDIERHVVVFGQIKSKLSDLQSMLQPLEAEETGAVPLTHQVRDLRDRLMSRIGHIERDDDGALAERVRKFTDTKRELEERVADLTAEFTKLAAIRKDIAAVFERLNGAVQSSSS
jgi:chromosome segregation ATPase